jgi:hypothetical protein
LKIIDFGFSNAEHICPGWNECWELKGAWRVLLLDRATSQFQNWIPGGFGLRDLFTVGFILLAFIFLVRLAN